MRWGEKLEFMAEAGPGDFIFIPPYVPHQEINANDDEPLSCVLVRSGQEPVVVNLDHPRRSKHRGSALGGQPPPQAEPVGHSSRSGRAASASLETLASLSTYRATRSTSRFTLATGLEIGERGHRQRVRNQVHV